MEGPGAAEEAEAAGSEAPARKRGRRPARPHPYAGEASSREELRLKPGHAALAVLGLATAMATIGLWLQAQYGYIDGDRTIHPGWEMWTRVPLFGGLALLGLGLVRGAADRQATIAGWLLFGAYWALTARDLLVREAQDYVNFAFAIVGVYLTVWIAYHVWLDRVRGVRDTAVRFLQVATFVAAGFYFLVDKVQFARIALIKVVSNQTKWMLDLFGQGDAKGLRFVTDHADSKSPTTFYYPDTVGTYPASPESMWDQMLLYTPDGDLQILRVSIILACTALQSIMLFVGLIVGTQASWQKKLKWSLLVGAVVYILNLVRNTGIIWFYGQGHASFWVMHNAIGKGGSLVAILLIALAVFRYFPEFLRSLIGVLDLVDRDGPLERALRLGRRRPAAPAAPAPGPNA